MAIAEPCRLAERVDGRARRGRVIHVHGEGAAGRGHRGDPAPSGDRRRRVARRRGRLPLHHRRSVARTASAEKITSNSSLQRGQRTVAAYGGFGGTSRCSRVTKRGPTFSPQNGHTTP